MNAVCSLVLEKHDTLTLDEMTNTPFKLRFSLRLKPRLFFVLLTVGASVPIQGHAQTAPVITVHPSPQTILAGGNVTLSAAVTGNPAPALRWRKDGINLPATASTLTLTNVTANDIGYYTLNASNSAGTVNSNAALINVVTAPSSAVVSFLVGEAADLGYNPVPASDAEAARFLIQSTFGPSSPGISELRTRTYAEWLTVQIGLPASVHLPFYQRRRDENVTQNNGNDGYGIPRQEAWWQMSLTAPDQLRQRMAFALSEIFVISQDGALDSANEGCAVYYDILVRNAFGNYRQLLEEVTLSPAMGTYLSMIRNRKPNPQTGTQPDENFAREIMQLFSIGLSQLNDDGTPKLDANGKTIPTYTQADIVGLAHVFTGWGPYYDPANPPRWSYTGEVASVEAWFNFGEDYLHPMSYYQNYADLQTRTIVGGVTVANSLTGPQRLKLALDTLFNHPNVGPFLGRQLIQRFVTSNPSRAYVQRVAAAFNNNGAGVRGDLGAVIRAVLLDPEARRSAALTDPRFGKLTEPLLRLTRFFRAFPIHPAPQAGPNETRLLFHTLRTLEEQNPLYSPTVFNFFKPGFTQPGLLAANGLLSPEFQIFTDVTSIWSANRFYNTLIWGDYIYDVATGNGLEYDPDFSELRAILNTSATPQSSPVVRAQLVDTLNERLLGGTMSAALRQTILESLNDLPYYGDKTQYQEDVITVAVYLSLFSPEFNISR